MLADSHRVSVSCISSIVLLAASWASPARAADEAPVDARETARLHYAHGLELAGKAEYEAALREFTEAYAVSPHYAVLYNIGQAYIALGRPTEAIENLSKYLHDGQDQVPPARRQEVQSQITLLESLFAELTVTTDRPGALITIDGREVGRTPLYQSVRLPAGTHRVFGTLPNMVVDRTVTLANGERQILNLELPSASPMAAEIAEARPPAPIVPGVASDVRLQLVAAPPLVPARDKQPETGTASWRTKSVVGYTAIGLGAALGGAALGVYLWNRDRDKTWKANDSALRHDMGAIDFYSRQVANNQLADSLTKANRLILGLSVVGGLALAGGVTLLVVDRMRGRTTQETTENTAGPAPTGISLGWGSQGPWSGSVSWRASW